MNKPKKHRMARLYEGRKSSLWDKVTGRRNHRLSASVTGEGDWEVEVPQIRMSRAFAVMLVLHVIAVGGLFAYRIWGRDEEPKAGADTAKTSATPAVAAVAAVDAGVPSATGASSPAAPAASDPAPATPELKTYIWRAGDSMQLVAARFNVSTSSLREANPEKTMVPGTEIVIPRAGRIFGGAEVAAPSNPPTPIFDPQASPAASSATPEPPAPRAMEVPEDPQTIASVPDVVPPPDSETSATAKQVTSRAVVEDTPPPPARTAETKKPVKTDKPASNKPAAKPEKAVATKESGTKPPARTAGQRVHVVAKGDTVYNLARKYGFSPEEIAKANGLKEFRIALGQQLKIPVKR